MRKGSFLHLRTVWRKLTMQPSTPRQSPTSTRTSALGKGSCAWVTFVHRQMAFTTQLGLELWDGVPCGCHSTCESSDTTQSLQNSLQLAFPTCVSTLYSFWSSAQEERWLHILETKFFIFCPWGLVCFRGPVRISGAQTRTFDFMSYPQVEYLLPFLLHVFPEKMMWLVLTSTWAVLKSIPPR